MQQVQSRQYYPQFAGTRGLRGKIFGPARSPRLFWHHDWFAWEEERNYQCSLPEKTQAQMVARTRRRGISPLSRHPAAAPLRRDVTGANPAPGAMQF